jgi:hypothetical protein
VAAAAPPRQPSSWYSQQLPADAAKVVVDAARRDATLRIFATEPYADWLLWKHPELAGRVAFDVRFELMSDDQFRKVVDLYELRPRWNAALRGYRLVVLEPARNEVKNALLAERGTRKLYEDANAVVLLRASAP